MSIKSFENFMRDLFTSDEVPNTNEFIKRHLAEFVKEKVGFDVTPDIKPESFTSDELTVDGFKDLIWHVFTAHGIKTLRDMEEDGSIESISLEHLDALTTKTQEVIDLLNDQTKKITGICVATLTSLGHTVFGAEKRQEKRSQIEDDGDDEL